jgi:hypothetical protein
MRFIPTVISPHGGSLPRTDPRAKADFIGQHLRAGWCASDAAVRYEMWVSGGALVILVTLVAVKRGMYPRR